MADDETPEEHKRRLARERQQRFREEHPEYRKETEQRYNVGELGKARTQRYQGSAKGKQTRQTYRSGSEDYKVSQSIYQGSEQGRAAHERYTSSEKAKQTRADYFASPEGRAMLDRRNAKRREQREAKKGQPARMPWLIRRPPQTEEERAAANRAMVAEKAQTSKYPTGKGTRNQPTVHRWWRKIGG